MAPEFWAQGLSLLLWVGGKGGLELARRLDAEPQSSLAAQGLRA